MNTTATRVMPKAVLWATGTTEAMDLIHFIDTDATVPGAMETAICGYVLHDARDAGTFIDRWRPFCRGCAYAVGWTDDRGDGA